jgi:phage tail-like protein
VIALESTMSDINYKSFKFIVWTDDQLVAGFSEMSRLQNAEITLERGITHDASFGHWVSEVSDSSAGTRKDLQIDVLNAAGQTVIRHRLLRCRVSACQSLPDLDADTNAVAIATLGLETELRTASEEPS